ncbi:deoxyribose-phosphate aldolase [Salidesulfovibrio onnuriiensis]|uniref:deoxyribose-phosphate aldolase n=1 Tax=Salidesulfovibrio onnuriiensis TaxID=2583823 RepID=UPI0011C91697|nr:deoxyribose-phosphate aldolase [Salidesulfovibrio onnuriiensis]
MTRNQSEFAHKIEYALLRPEATAADVDTVCSQAVRLGCYGVVVNPVHIKLATWLLKNESPIPICAVGYPTGATLPQVKSFEAGEAVKLGAREINMVLGLAAFLADDHKTVIQTIQGVITATSDKVPVKVIVEAGLLTPEQVALAGKLCVEAGARYVVTSTGYGWGQAMVSHVRLLREAVGESLGIVACGGIRGYKDAVSMIEAGADRIGSSAAPAILGASF